MTTTLSATQFVCPYCAHHMDACSDTDASAPRPKTGDIGLCIRCAKAGILVVKRHGITLRKPTAQEAAGMARDPELARMKAAVIIASRHPTRGWDLEGG